MPKIKLVNSTSKTCREGWHRNRERPWILWFGAYGSTRLLVYARHLQDALDECIDWIAEHAPGLLYNDQVAEAYQECIDQGMTQEQAWDESQTDMTCAGNCGDFIASWEWGIVAEDPSPAEIAAIHHDREVRV